MPRRAGSLARDNRLQQLGQTQRVEVAVAGRALDGDGEPCADGRHGGMMTPRPEAVVGWEKQLAEDRERVPALSMNADYQLGTG